MEPPIKYKFLLRRDATPVIYGDIGLPPLEEKYTSALAEFISEDLRLLDDSTLRWLLMTTNACRSAGELTMVLRRLTDARKEVPRLLGEGNLETKLWAFAREMEIYNYSAAAGKKLPFLALEREHQKQNAAFIYDTTGGAIATRAADFRDHTQSSLTQGSDPPAYLRPDARFYLTPWDTPRRRQDTADTTHQMQNRTPRRGRSMGHMKRNVAKRLDVVIRAAMFHLPSSTSPTTLAFIIDFTKDEVASVVLKLLRPCLARGDVSALYIIRSRPGGRDDDAAAEVAEFTHETPTDVRV